MAFRVATFNVNLSPALFYISCPTELNSFILIKAVSSFTRKDKSHGGLNFTRGNVEKMVDFFE